MHLKSTKIKSIHRESAYLAQPADLTRAILSLQQKTCEYSHSVRLHRKFHDHIV